MSRKEFAKRINSDEIAGRVIRLCAVFEDRLNVLLVEYFADLAPIKRTPKSN